MRKLSLGGINKTIAASMAALVVLVAAPQSAAAVSVATARDCDNNAVVHCGALTTKELQTKLMNPNDASARNIINAFGISNGDLEAIDAKAVAGEVTRDNRVLVNGNVVATNAFTAGRQNMRGSTVMVNQGTTFYVRPPSVSFRSDSLQAFVVMENNQFKYAIIASCGNPVKATPVTPPPAPPTTTIIKEVPKEVTKTVIVEKPVVETRVETKTVEVEKPVPQAIVNTGADDVALISLSSLTAGLGYLFVVKRRSILHS